jgi:hypothetical protein
MDGWSKQVNRWMISKWTDDKWIDGQVEGWMNIQITNGKTHKRWLDGWRLKT